MNNYIGTTDIGSMEYDKNFWNVMRGQKHLEVNIMAGRNASNGTYQLPLSSSNKFASKLCEESIFRKLGTVLHARTSDGTILVSDSEEIAKWVTSDSHEDIGDVANKFNKIPTKCHKLAITSRMDLDFIQDNGINVEKQLIPVFAKSFGKAEEDAFINGTGKDMPTGILHEIKGAMVGVTAASRTAPTFDEVIQLYMSVKPEYRSHGVWMMNDETALKLRTLKDANDNYLWNHNNDTILGKKVQISEFMPSCETGAKSIAFGDFNYYWIVERMPMSVRPLVEAYIVNGQIGHLAYEYLDGVLVRPEALKVMQMA